MVKGTLRALVVMAAAMAVAWAGWGVLRGMQGDPQATVTHIVDGDTLDVLLDGVNTRVRLLNIDTPELAHNGQPAECLAQEARDFLEQLAPVGSEVRLDYDLQRQDKYGRTLAGLFVGGALVNEQIAAAGLAKPIVVGGNERFYATVAAAAAQAEAARLGLFGDKAGCAGAS